MVSNSYENTVAAVEHVRKVLRELRLVGHSLSDETQTRYSMVDPVLRAVGWDTAWPAECRVEWRAPSGGKADYALFLEDSLKAVVEHRVYPVAVIEVKRVETHPDVGLVGLEGYIGGTWGMMNGVGAVTNGVMWTFYHVRESVLQMEDVETVRLWENSADECADLLYWWLVKKRLST